MKISIDTKEKLEFSKVIRVFQKTARSEIGSDFINALEPFDSREQLLKRHDLICSFIRLLEKHGDIPWLDNIQPVDVILSSGRSSSFLNGDELLLIQKMLKLAMKLKIFFQGYIEPFPSFIQIISRIRDLSSELKALSVIDEHGRIEDHASPRLREIREELFRNRALVRKSSSRLVHDPQISSYLQEKSMVMRNGRLAFPVRQEFVNRFPGLVIDRSSSGNTVFMEHEGLIPANNRIAILVSEEQEECERILRELTRLILKRERAVIDAQYAVGLVDYLYALHSSMVKGSWIIPEISKRSMFELKGIKHPLLTSNPVPLKISCGRNFRLLVITGPNTGGKTVALKTVGLAVLLAWHGLPIPAEEGSVIGDFSSIYLDIGDEQSIEQNLSTFSAHLTNIINILENSDNRSLLLLDELGAGTDPQEGAALGIAILDSLLAKKALTLATTHHNPIKRYAIGTSGVETASMEFDHRSLSPTYRLLMGIPGKSNAILIASRLGMPEGVLEKARSVRLGAEQSVEDLIGELQEKQKILDVTREKLLKENKELQKMKTELEKDLHRSEGQANKILSRAEDEAEKILEKAKETARSMIKDMQGVAESAAHREMQAHNQDANEQISSFFERKKKRKNKKTSQRLKDSEVITPEEGDMVSIEGTGFKGTLFSLSGKKAVVVSGPMRMEADPVNLVLIKRKARDQDANVSIKISRPTNVPSSVMVRGMTVDEAIPMVSRYLDQAMRAGYSSVMVIHGRGEGILRREVHELCRNLEYVQDYRLGGPSEGGYGVTIVSFRK